MKTFSLFRNIIITILIVICGVFVVACGNNADILIEAESFDEKGGWVVDNQSITVMGSPYLLAHGMGIPVADAKSRFDVGKPGDYAGAQFPSLVFTSVYNSTDLHLCDNGIIELLSNLL